MAGKWVAGVTSPLERLNDDTDANVRAAILATCLQEPIP
jgi:hypothetical protein